MTQVSEAALALLCRCRAEHGCEGPVSEGAVALAEWWAGLPVGGFARTIAERSAIERMIGGVMLPGRELGELLGGWSEGAVTAAAFRRPTGMVLPSAGTEAPPPAEALAVVRGRLGEVPPGPLFTHVRDPLTSDGFVITGAGIAVHMTPASFGAFRSAGEAALAEIAAR